MNNQTLITLGIPVYNGEKCIEITLESIFKSLSEVKDKTLIEILVSDNLSEDNTSFLVNKFVDHGLKINYYCNNENIGYDRNIDNIVKKASGKYVWFLGCGEKIKSDALLRLVEKLNNDICYTNILLDFDIYDEKKNIITNKRIYDFDNDILLCKKNDFTYNKYGSAVSSNIINRDIWLKILDKPLVVDGWCHVERILNMISINENSKTLLLSYPYFTLYREKNGWWTKPNSYLLLLLHIKVIKSMLYMGYDQKLVSQLQYKQSRFALISAIIQSKDYGLRISKKLFSDLFKLFKYDYFFWLFVLPILILPKQLNFLPKILIRILIYSKKILKNVKKNII